MYAMMPSMRGQRSINTERLIALLGALDETTAKPNGTLPEIYAMHTPYAFAGFEVSEAMQLPTGMVYPLLHRLEAQDLACGDWAIPDHSAHTYKPTKPRLAIRYTLTDKGKELAEKMLTKHIDYLIEIADRVVFRDHAHNTSTIERRTQA